MSTADGDELAAKKLGRTHFGGGQRSCADGVSEGDSVHCNGYEREVEGAARDDEEEKERKKTYCPNACFVYVQSWQF